MLARAIVAGASAQIRNMATVGGNLLQRTRCPYFYDDAARCNKRQPGAGCDALDGFNRIHAILGASPACVATHPSDMCVALAALDAIVHLEGAGRRRARCRSVDFHRLPGDTARHRDRARARRADHRGRAAAAAVRAALDLSQGARPGELRLRAGLGRRRARAAPDGTVARRAAGAGRRGAQAVAGAGRPRRRCAAQPPTEAAFRAAAEAELADAAAAPRQRASRSSSPSARSSARPGASSPGDAHEHEPGSCRRLRRHVPDGWCPARQPDPLTDSSTGMSASRCRVSTARSRCAARRASPPRCRCEGLVYAALVPTAPSPAAASPRIDTAAAEAAPGVVAGDDPRECAADEAAAGVHGRRQRRRRRATCRSCRTTGSTGTASRSRVVLAETQEQADHAAALIARRL